MEYEPFSGDTLDLALSLDGKDLFRVKTVQRDGALYIGVDQLTDGAGIVGVSGIGGAGLPATAAAIGPQDLVVNLSPDGEWLDLAIVGRLADGSRVTWNVSVNPNSGEVIAGSWASADPQTAEMVQKLKNVMAQANRLALANTG
jgi:hypothetical protein